MEDKGFFGTLFDFSFSSFITPSFIRVFYGIGLVVIALSAVAFVISVWADYTIWGAIFALFGAIAAALLWTILARIGAEVAIVSFRAYDNTVELLGRDAE